MYRTNEEDELEPDHLQYKNGSAAGEDNHGNKTNNFVIPAKAGI
jgi:hypothetical protein